MTCIYFLIDFLAKVVITPGSSLSLFTSKEQEWEQRCQLLKRLTFVIFCSDVDQYQRAMPDIQGNIQTSRIITALADNVNANSLLANFTYTFSVSVLLSTVIHISTVSYQIDSQLLSLTLKVKLIVGVFL